ncbi:protease inhibitor I9 family protein [Cecembia lonarensis]|uniref:Aqualysin-1 n=1 Tax=Cecembia lonarensis (strain CCUG 58316 / KCTC 22772 / LW9) TaxID=1225176 RepID=K1KTR8_CECL9|nr:protease inhibitor I9 family protein [Cecembia lonarensis]EKB47595.1 Aqualysin-1 precursor [Cecembia lonarensis LW9]
MSAMKNFKLKNTLPLWGVLMVLMVFSCQDLNMEDQKTEDLSKVDQISSNVVPGKYIVTLHSNQINFRKSDKYEDVQAGMRKIANEVLLRCGMQEKVVDAVFGNVFTGFVLELNNEELNMLSKDPDVKSITPDKYAISNHSLRNNNPNRGGKGSDSEPNPEPEPEPDPGNGNINPNWYLDRIDQRSLPLDNKFNTSYTGKGVTVYLLGMPLDPTLDEFENRAKVDEISFSDTGKVASRYEELKYLGNIFGAVVAGKSLGVARDAKLVAIDFLYEQPIDYNRFYEVYLSSYIVGLDYILGTAKGPSVILTASISYILEPLLEDAFNKLYEANISIFTGVTNADSNIPTCTTSPSGFQNVFTVGPTLQDDRLGFFGWQFGDCINLFAPGVDILVDGFSGSEIERFDISYWNSGALGAGVAALYLDSIPTATAQQVYDFLFETSTKNIVRFSKSINNHLLFSGLNSIGAGEIDPNRPNYAFDLEASSQKARGNSYMVFFFWNKVESETGMLNVYQDGEAVGSVTNGGSFMISVSGKDLPPRTYKFCVPKTNLCSNEVIVTFN